MVQIETLKKNYNIAIHSKWWDRGIDITTLIWMALFAGSMTLGILIQTSSAFREVHSSFSLFINNWTRITELRSIFRRLNEFELAIGYKKKVIRVGTLRS